MNKREFKCFVKQKLQHLSLEQQEKTLKKIKMLWIQELIDEFYETTIKGYQKCHKCNKYSKVEQFTYSTETVKVSGETVFIDAGYGDDDEIADVTYRIKYCMCPKCKDKKVVKRIAIEEENRRRKYN